MRPSAVRAPRGLVAALAGALLAAAALTPLTALGGPPGGVPPGQAKKGVDQPATQPDAPAPDAPGQSGSPGPPPWAASASKSPGPPEHTRGRGRGRVGQPAAPVTSPAPQTPASEPAAASAPAATGQSPASSTPQPSAGSAPGDGATSSPGGTGVRPRAGTGRAARRSGAATDGADASAADGADAAETATTGASGPAGGGAPSEAPGAGEPSSPVVRTVRDIIEVVPGWMKVGLGALAGLSLLLAGGYGVTALRARSLARQRAELLGEVGLLQRALLPAVPETVSALATSVAYRPADGPAAGGDFYDVLTLPEGRVGFVLGDLSGHGRRALERTAFLRYTLRAYLEAGLSPRAALGVAGRVIGDGLGEDFATVLLAVHDPRTGSLTYASAGHPAPIVTGDAAFEPVGAGGSPPIGIGEPTGLRQTTVPLPPGSRACLYTDGLTEARTANGLLGREGLERLLGELGPKATATDLVERVAEEATAIPDDVATCLLAPTAGVTAGGFRSEQLELSATDLDGRLLERFLDECEVPAAARADAVEEARRTAATHGGAVVAVAFGNRRAIDVLPRNVESIELASPHAPAPAPAPRTARTAARRLRAG